MELAVQPLGEGNTGCSRDDWVGRKVRHSTCENARFAESPVARDGPRLERISGGVRVRRERTNETICWPLTPASVAMWLAGLTVLALTGGFQPARDGLVCVRSLRAQPLGETGVGG